VLPDLKVRDRRRDDFIFQHLIQMFTLSLRPRYARQQTQPKCGCANWNIDLSLVKSHSSPFEGLDTLRSAPNLNYGRFNIRVVQLVSNPFGIDFEGSRES